MSKRSIRVQGGVLIWDDGEIGIMLRGSQGEVGEDVQRRAYAVQKRMKRLAPKWRGDLERGIHVQSIGQSPTGPVSRVTSDAPHTIVAEVGRGPVTASGLVSPSQRRTRSTMQLSSKSLTWGSDRSSNPLALTVRTSPGGGFVLRPSVRAAKGSRFMENSIDAAVD